MSQTHKQKIAALLAVTLILCDLMSGSPAHLQARQKNNQTEWSEEPTPEPTVEPTAEPTEEPSPQLRHSQPKLQSRWKSMNWYRPTPNTIKAA